MGRQTFPASVDRTGITFEVYEIVTIAGSVWSTQSGRIDLRQRLVAAKRDLLRIPVGYVAIVIAAVIKSQAKTQAAQAQLGY